MLGYELNEDFKSTYLCVESLNNFESLCLLINPIQDGERGGAIIIISIMPHIQFPHPWGAPKRPILNRVKYYYF